MFVSSSSLNLNQQHNYLFTMSSTVIDTMCQDCATIQQDGISSEQLEVNATMCQACKDVALFKQPPPNEDCPICLMPVPFMSTGSKYKSCCGKIICSGCIHAVNKMKGETKCPFCRVPDPESEEEIRGRIKKRVEMDDAEAIYCLGCYYYNGELGFPQDWDKALELWHRAGELGDESAYYNIGSVYYYGRGVENDFEKLSITGSWQLWGEMQWQGTTLAPLKTMQEISISH